MALKIIRQGQLKVSKSIMSQNEYILLIDFPIISIICKKNCNQQEQLLIDFIIAEYFHFFANMKDGLK